MPAKMLRPFLLPTDYRLAQLRPQPTIDFNSPATLLMLDFRLHPALTLPSDMRLEEAQHSLANSHSTAVLVVDRFDQFCGVATAQCLSDQAIMQLVSRGRRREELQLGDLMQPKARLSALSFEEVKSLSVGKMVSILRREQVSIMMVVDDNQREVIGIMSAPEIERVLDLRLELKPQPTFMELFDALMH